MENPTTELALPFADVKDLLEAYTDGLDEGYEAGLKEAIRLVAKGSDTEAVLSRLRNLLNG